MLTDWRITRLRARLQRSGSRRACWSGGITVPLPAALGQVAAEEAMKAWLLECEVASSRSSFT
jgi:hypothetical protein